MCVCPQPLIRVRGLLPLCGEVQLRAVVLYARHRRTEELHDASRGWSDPRIATTGVPRSEYDTICPLVPFLFFLCLSARTQLSWSRRFSAFFRVLVFPSLWNRFLLSASRWTVTTSAGSSTVWYLHSDGDLCSSKLGADPGNVVMAASGAHKCAKSEKLDEAQALAKSCAGRPDFLPCDGLSICATHSHGKCFKLHWCCHLGWCHCKFVLS